MKKDIKWKIEKEFKVLKMDLELLEKIREEFDDKLADYDGKSINRWFEKRLKKIDDDLYINDVYKDNIAIKNTKRMEFDTEYGNEFGRCNIVFFNVADENGDFPADEFQKDVKKYIEAVKRNLKQKSIALEKFDEAMKEMKKIYKKAIKFQNEYPAIASKMQEFKNFYEFKLDNFED
ncbi:MAG: hypothetical protein ACQEQF_00595 [Bacillota bacterium]